MAQQNRRRPSSANPTTRPRKVAGRSGPNPPTSDAGEVEASAPVPIPVAEPPAPPDVEPEVEPELDVASEPEPEPQLLTADDAAVPMAGLVGSPRTTRILLRLIALLCVVALAGGIFLLVDGDAEPAASPGTGIEADAETPVRITGSEAQVAVAEAAQAAYTIVATSYQDYQAQVDEAAALMTPAFAEQYRQTAADVEDAIVAGKTEVQVSVVAQGVVRADQEQVQALVFLNMFTTKNGKEPVFTPYRVLVTVLNTDQGWLVADLETK